MLGGHKSGFTHVEHVLKPRLMLVKGKHTPRIREVTEPGIVITRADLEHIWVAFTLTVLLGVFYFIHLHA